VLTANRTGKIMKQAVRRSLESMSNIYKILQETLQGIVVVKAFATERHERRRFFHETKSLYKKSVRVATIDALSDPVLEMLALSTVTIALLTGSYLVLNKVTFLDLGPLKLQLASQPMMMEDLLTLYAMLAGVSDPIRKLSTSTPDPSAAPRPRTGICGPDGPPAAGRRQAQRRRPGSATASGSSSTTSASATRAGSRSCAGSS
jgi:ABC-type multidrug transport system fused ATPase/permease subunit